MEIKRWDLVFAPLRHRRAVDGFSEIVGSSFRSGSAKNSISPAGSGIRTGPALGYRVLRLFISLILLPLVSADPWRTFDRPVSEQQRQQAIKTDIVWSGCGTYSYCHPLRIPINLGPIRVPALVDSGSDYDAIDRHLALELSRCGNMSFRSRTNVGKRSISGFAAAVQQETEFVSEWEISFAGSITYGGPMEDRTLVIPFAEFESLLDPVILGSPRLTGTGEWKPYRNSVGWRVYGYPVSSYPVPRTRRSSPVYRRATPQLRAPQECSRHQMLSKSGW